MPRGPRNAPGGLVYHALNRGVGRRTLFHKDADYAAFERVLFETLERYPTRLLDYCLMPNHWHMALYPTADGELTEFLRRVTHLHTQRYHAHYQTSGTGHLYQGRFKSFPVQSDPHLLVVLRYIERNPLRANLVDRAELWPWCSLRRRLTGAPIARLLSPWPVDCPDDWLTFVNEPQSPAELDAVRHALKRGRPFGSDDWSRITADSLGLQATLRPQGRPRVLAASGLSAVPTNESRPL